MQEVLRRAAEEGFEAALLVGNPDYYARFGFHTSTNYGIRNTDGIPDRYVQIATLEKEVLAGRDGTVTFAEMEPANHISDKKQINEKKNKARKPLSHEQRKI